jgi:8-oxo-dGTP diphosphatase
MSNENQIRVAVAVILCDEKDAGNKIIKSVIVARRPEHLHQGGLLEFPGGKIGPEETVERALCRELYEELGIDVLRSPKYPLTQIEHHYPDKSVFLDVWTVDGYRGKATGLEGQEVFKIAIDELDYRDFPAANVKIIDQLRNSH